MKFHLEFDQIDRCIMGFMREALLEIMDLVVRASIFGEAEVEVSRRHVCKL